MRSGIKSFFGLAGVIFLFSSLTAVQAADSSATSKKLVFAIDGLSFDAFQVAQQRGLFKSFRHSGRHVAPYPSMTEPSWTEIMGGKELFPLQGNARTIEASYFNIDSMTPSNDPRNVFNRAAGSANFFRAFDYYYNPFLEGLMYFPNDSTSDMELDELEKEITTQFKGDHFVAYLSSVDAIAHTQKDRLYPLLEKLSARIEKIVAEQRRKHPGLESWIISDHGNEGAFAEGQAESYLVPVTLARAAQASGLEFSDSKLTRPDQISAPVLALGNVANVYFKDLSRRRAFALQAMQESYVDLVTYLEVKDGAKFITIHGAGGSEARLHWSSRGFAYQSVNGNPLGLATDFISGGTLKWISDPEMSEAFAQTSYPDAAYRLAQGGIKQVENEPDLIVNLKNGYCMNGDFTQYVQMARTHGALSAKSSLGLIASSTAAVPALTRSADVMKVVGLSPQKLFHNVEDLFHKNPSEVLGKLESQPPTGIETRVLELSNDLIFQRINKITSSTMDVISSKDVNQFVAQLKKIQATPAVPVEGRSRTDLIVEAFRQVDPAQILNNVDRFFGLKDKISPKDAPEAILSRLKNEVFAIPGLGSLRSLEPAIAGAGSDSESGEAVNIFRKLVMKIYTIPYLLNEWLNIPEHDTALDTRNPEVARQWFQDLKPAFRGNPGLVLDDKKVVQDLFQAIFQERRLKQELHPATFPLFYNPVSRDVTVVYVPGIYNELFDTEIFSRGLTALRENLGLRVLYLDVDGRCSTQRNAAQIYERLKEDTRQRLERGYPIPRYVILGYSKGGVDATESLLIDPTFTRSQILGLVSIASPHHGTSILDTVDLPAMLVDQTVARPIPADCRAQPGTQSIRRAPRDAFLAKNIDKLAGLTRYFSVSFASEVAQAHPWMKITKNIARFQGRNDGVVTVESSKFPEALNPVDLGIVEADHLAGILASNFPQGPFLESVLLTLFELHAFDKANLRSWYEAVSKRAPSLIPGFHKRSFSAELLKATAGSSKSVVDAVGPFPSAEGATAAQTQENDEWFDSIARENAILGTSLRCLGQNEMDDFAKSLRRASAKSEYALKPFSLSCEQGKITLSIETYSHPFYKPWQSNTYERTQVKTLGELVTALLSSGLASGENPLQPKTSNVISVPKSNRAPISLPKSSLVWSAEEVLDMRSFNKTLETAKVEPMEKSAYPNGISMVFDHQSMKDFRKEFGFLYESTSPGGWDDSSEGYFPVLDKEGENELVALRMRSKNNSIRMTTAAMRFKPADFHNFELKIKVNKGPAGADPSKGGPGTDDSAFQIWFTVRNLHGLPDRAMFTSEGGVKIFGYHWGEDAVNGAPQRQAGELFENYYSKKNFVIATLPEAWQIVLEGTQARGKWLTFQRDLVQDLKKAFPNDRVEDMEIIGITIQTDSNDTKSSSEAFFREAKFKP